MVAVVVSKVDKQEVTLNVSEEGGASSSESKVLVKDYDSLYALKGMLSKWYGKYLPAIPDLNGWFAPSTESAKTMLQKFLDDFKTVPQDSFPVKYFYRLYDLKGKVVIVTGASSGIGKQNAYQFAGMGAHVILACRSESKTTPIIEDIKARTGNPNVEYAHLDLVSLESVKKFVENFKSRNLPLHILVNNAALVKEGLTDYGIDLTFGICHIGPFLLTASLLDILKNTPNSRIVNVASEAALMSKIPLPWPRIKSRIPLNMRNAMEAYSYAKLANLLCSKALARKLRAEGSSVTVYTLHPGVVATDIWRALPSVLASVAKKFMINEEEGSLMTLYCAVADECAKESGNFYMYKFGQKPPEYPQFENVEYQDSCWEECEKICGLK